jgi:hypothetical protein
VFAVKLTLFALGWIGIVYLFNCWLAKLWIKLKLKDVLLYVTTMGALGILGEIIFDTSYNFIFGHPLWQYRLMPIHSAYTSSFSLYLWGTVGFYLYLLHGTLRKRGASSPYRLATIFCIEAITLEVLVNVTYLTFFGNYIFYYLPGDLWHITSLQTLPLYLVAGFISVIILEFAKRRPMRATFGSTLLAISLAAIR